jgi:hypothetical protein
MLRCSAGALLPLPLRGPQEELHGGLPPHDSKPTLFLHIASRRLLLTAAQLNTSRLGYNLLNASTSGSNPISNLFHDIQNHFSEEINEAAGDIAQALGVDDFYSVHILDYCYGDYTPGPVPNATLSSKDIHKNLTACSNTTAPFHFDPTAIIQQKLNESGVDITLDDLNWPEDIQKGIDALNALETTMFVLYCIAIGFIGISFLAALPAVFAAGRLAACVNVMFASLGFLAIGLASALVTAVIVKASNIINKYGREIGLEAQRGGKFLTITWVATGLMLLALVFWMFEVCFGHRRRRDTYVHKQG